MQFYKKPIDVTSKSITDPHGQEGVRGLKKRETRQRIAETGLKLFLARGYEGTTLDAIAEEAGISRRTFFSYFKSKDEIMLAWQSGDWDAICTELLKVSPDEVPLDAVRKTLVRHVAGYENDTMVAIDRVMRASETLLAKKQAAYAVQEEALYDVLCQVWRQPQRRAALRMVAMASMGALRIAIAQWQNQSGTRSAIEFLEEAFTHLKAEI